MSRQPELRIVRLDEAVPQRWRNGGGFTRELLAWPTADDWQLRLSVADIESDGPFSTFAGVQRWFCVLQGGAVRLAVDGQQHLLRPGDAPLAFAGEARTEAWLTAGATRDLNLMLRGRRGALVPVRPGADWQPPGAPWGLFAMDGGRVSLTRSSTRDPTQGSSRACGPAGAADAAGTGGGADTWHVTELPATALLACFEPAAGPVRFEPAAAPAAAWWWWSSGDGALPPAPPALPPPPAPTRTLP